MGVRLFSSLPSPLPFLVAAIICALLHYIVVSTSEKKAPLYGTSSKGAPCTQVAIAGEARTMNSQTQQLHCTGWSPVSFF